MSVMASPMCIVALDAAVGFVFDPRGKKRGFHVVAEQHSTAFYGGFLAFPVGWATQLVGFRLCRLLRGIFLSGVHKSSMSCWVLNSGTLLGTGNVDIGVHFRTFSVCAVCLEIVGIPPFWHEKGLPDFSENPQGGVRGIRTLEPLKTTNTLAGCPYRPLRHDSTVLPFSRRNSM